MPAVATRADALRLESSGVEVVSLTAMGTIAGVEITAVSARNGPGTGRLRCRWSDTVGRLPLTVAWLAPGSNAWGAPVGVAADGDFLVEDGEDHNKWVRVTATKNYLQAGDAAQVMLGDRYNTAIASDDVSAAEAASGDFETYSVDIVNDSAETVRRVGVWLDPSAPSGVAISASGGGGWVHPTTEATCLELGDLTPVHSVTLYFSRTILPAADADPAVFNGIHYRWFGPW